MARNAQKLRLLAYAFGHVMRRIHRNRLTILMFHGFTDKEHTGLENAQHKHLHVKTFDTFLGHLAKHYHPISMDEAVRHLNNGTRLPKNSVVLTFDDGFLSNYKLAYPRLQKWGIPGLIYLATEFVDEKKPIWVDRVDHALGQSGKSVQDLNAAKKHLKRLPQDTIEMAVSELEEQCGGTRLDLKAPGVSEIYRPLEWSQVREMQDSGLITFGAHTHTHKIIGRCTEKTIRQEVLQSKEIIEKETGRPCTHFCYPNGGADDYTPRSETILQETGFQSSVLALGGLNKVPCPAFPLNRLGVTNALSYAEFQLTVCGFLPWLNERRKRRALKA